MDNAKRNLHLIESLDIIENFLYLMAKKEHEIKDLYERLELQENRQNRNTPDLSGYKFPGAIPGAYFTALVADPISPSRVRLKEILSHDAGCLVIGEASTGRELVDSYYKHKPGFVIAEIELPTIDEGYDALKEIKASNPRATVIVMSRQVNDLILLKVMEIGAFDFMLKPINHLRLLKNIERIRHSA